MRKVLLALACAATVGLAGARADVTYSYVTDLSTYAGATAGTQVAAKVYPDTVIDANVNRRDPNATFTGTPSGFGIAPTVVDPTPSTATVAGLIVNADITSNANTKGPVIKAAENGGNKILLGTFNLIIGTQNSSFQVTPYGGTKNTLTQANKDLDFGTQAVNGYNGAQTNGAANGFFSFAVTGAAIPEPSSMALCGLIATGMGYCGFRRRKTTVTEQAPVA
jgi:hypothetical protein